MYNKAILVFLCFARTIGTRFLLLFLCVVSSAFYGCAVSTSGNLLGEAAATRFSTTDKKFRFVEVGHTLVAAGEDRFISSSHCDTEISGGSLSLRASLLSFDYSFLGQNGGMFLSLPLTIPLDIGIRPSVVQWIGPFYFGAGVSLVGGFYPNLQDDDYEPEADDSFGRFDGFILYNLGGGAMLDIGKRLTVGAYANYERMALNSAGSTVRNYDFPNITVMGEDRGKENLPAYARRANVMTLGVNAFVKMKNPLGFYAEYSPGTLLKNDGWWKFRIGGVLLY